MLKSVFYFRFFGARVRIDSAACASPWLLANGIGKEFEIALGLGLGLKNITITVTSLPLALNLLTVSPLPSISRC